MKVKPGVRTADNDLRVLTGQTSSEKPNIRHVSNEANFISSLTIVRAGRGVTKMVMVCIHAT